MQAHAPGAGTDRVTQRDVDVACPSAVDRNLGHRAAAHVVDAPLRRQGADQNSVAGHAECGAGRDEIGPANLFHLVQPHLVSRYLGGVADFHAHIVFALKAAHHRHPDDEHRHPEVGQQHAEITARLGCQAQAQACRRVFTQPRHKIQDGRAGNPGRQHQAQADHRCPVAQQNESDNRTGDTHTDGPAQTPRQINGVGLAPTCHRTDPHQEQGGGHQRDEDGVEVRWPDREFAHA